MSKTILQEFLNQAKQNYTWTLYFFTTRKQRNTGFLYEAKKVRFNKNEYIDSYARQLLEAVLSFQVNPVSVAENYNGFNTKVSCDKLSVDNSLIRDSFTAFRNSLTSPGDVKLKEHYKGYVLDGQPNQGANGPSLTFIKLANPMVPLSSKKAVIFKRSDDDSLDGIEEQYCRLYLTTDSIVLNGVLYSFNHSFEKLFNIEQTLHNVKNQAITTILNAGFISNGDDFTSHALSTNSRTFISLSDDRISRARDHENRAGISETYNIPLNAENQFELTAEASSRLIKYLCYKAFKDAETNDVLEASSISKLNIVTAVQ